MTKSIVVFASGSGSNFEAIVEQLHKKPVTPNDPGSPRCEVALIVCDQPGAKCLERASRLGIPAIVINPTDYNSKAQYEQAIINKLEPINPDLIALAGYMRIIGPTLLGKYQGKIINIHPALLPAFPGKDGIGDALKYGVKVTGVTIHYVDAGVDTGHIIAQQAIQLNPADSEQQTRNRIHAIEHELYPKTIATLLTNAG